MHYLCAAHVSISSLSSLTFLSVVGVISYHIDSSIFRDEASLAIHIVLMYPPPFPFPLTCPRRLIPTLVDAWKYRHLDNLPPLETNPQPVSRIPSGETRGRTGSAGFPQHAYSPSLRNLPAPLRPRRSSSVNDMYSKRAPQASDSAAAFAIQSLKGNKPSAVVKHIRRSSLTNSEPAQTPNSRIPLFRNHSATRTAAAAPHPLTRRSSSGSVELSSLQPQVPQRTSSLPKSGNSSLRSLYERSRVIIAPSLTVVTDRSERTLGDATADAAALASADAEDAKEQQPSPLTNPNSPSGREHGNGHGHEHHERKTRIFEYDENDELVEVTDEVGNGYGGYGDGDDDLYDEEYIDVVYEDDDDEGDEVGYEDGGEGGGGYGNREDEFHIYEATSSMEVASHITWM
jgi:hypothetical protein